MTKQFQFKGKLMKVVTKKKILPNGRKCSFDIVEHPGAVLIVPFLENDRIVMIHQYRPVLNAYLYELPAGTLNPKERPLACAARELIEETNFQADRLTEMGKIFPVPGYSTERIIIFKAEGLKFFEGIKTSSDKASSREKIGQKDLDEVIRVCPMSAVQLRNLFKRGRINDAKTICALAFCGLL